MIDFNNADEQKIFGNGPIPAGSMVKVKMEVRTPSDDKKSAVDPALTRPASNNGNDYLNCKFEVVAGQFNGVKIWQNYVMAGSEKAMKISMATLRAIVEATRNVNPKDPSPQATQARKVNSFADFSGMEFPVVVGIQPPKKGDLYINNTIHQVITPDKPEYQEIMSGGEKITDTPIPEIPGQNSSKPASSADTSFNPADWGRTTSTQQAITKQNNNSMPSWAI
jgi:hypothetical protein